jgi:regulator of sirC expression with transglutaminase-like and TPR domain
MDWWHQAAPVHAPRLNCFMVVSLQFKTLTVLEYFAALVVDDASLPLMEAAVSIAQDEFPQLDIQTVLAEVDGLARKLTLDATPVYKLRHLNHFFFHELGFAGNVNDYYDHHNSYLHHVLSSRRGIPITLAVLYMELATQIGLAASGVSFPGHFLIKLRLSSGAWQGDVLIDPFNGQSLSQEQLEERLAPYKQQAGLQDEFDAPLGLFLQTATAREIVARMLRNLKQIYRDAADTPRLLQVVSRLIVLHPRNFDERRDRAWLHAELGFGDAALQDFHVYLENVPDAPDRELVFKCLSMLQLRGTKRLD